MGKSWTKKTASEKEAELDEIIAFLRRARMKLPRTIKRDICDDLDSIANAVSPSKERIRLRRISSKLKTVVSEIKLLPHDHPLKSFSAAAEAANSKCEALCKSLPVKAQSGGASTKWPRQRAAHCAELLMYYHGLGHVVTLTKGKTYIELAGKLFEAATGKRAGEMQPACVHHIKRLRATYDFPTAKIMREIRKNDSKI